MRALILAAGRGERLRPITDHTPKPLVTVGNQTLIEHLILRLRAAGITELVINTAWLADQLHQRLSDGANHGVNIEWSDEPEDALETGGGIFNALPLLGEKPFIVANADVYSELDFRSLPSLQTGDLAHLCLVPNPQHNLGGDFSLSDGRVANDGEPRYTFSGISVLSPELFCSTRPGRFPLAPILRATADAGRLSGQLYSGLWSDVGTAERLTALSSALREHV